MGKHENTSSVPIRIIQGLIVVTVFCCTLAAYSIATRPAKYHPKYQTIAHRFLDLESKYTPVPGKSYELLDNLIDAVKVNSHFDPGIVDLRERQRQLLQVFGAIDSVVIANNFIFPPGEYTSTLGQALEESVLTDSQIDTALEKSHNARRADQIKNNTDKKFHLMSCEPAAFLYMGIAQALGFELRPVLLPDHVFVRAQLDAKHWINWDPNRGRSITDEEYARDWNGQGWQIKEKIFLHPLSPDETLSEMYTDIACRLADFDPISNIDPIVECDRQSVQLNPQSINACENLSFWLLYTPHPADADLTEANKWAQHALEMEPDTASAHSAMAYVCASSGNIAGATAEMQKAIDLKPDNLANLQATLTLMQNGDSTYQVFKSERPIQFWILYEQGWLYLLLLAAAAIAIATAMVFRRRLLASSADDQNHAHTPNGTAALS